MKGITLAALAGAILLSGCASSQSSNGQEAVAERGYTPVGTYIPRKAPSRTDNVTIVDKQALENDRNTGANVLNGPGMK